MNIIDVTGVVSKEAFVEKEIGSIVIYSDLKLESFANEKIEIIIDRNGRNNINITPSKISLKKFCLASSYGSDAVTAFATGVDAEFETVVVCELTDEGQAFHLEGNDKIKISLSGLDNTKRYVIDGLEDPNVTTELYQYEEKNVMQATTSVGINTSNFDMMVLEDNASITSLDFRYGNGRTCTHSKRELRAMAQDIDPTAIVHKDGKVSSGYVGLLQFALIDVKEIVIRKDATDDVDILFRVDNSVDTHVG